MDTQRLDLGPNRWMAVAGQAFLYVTVKKGRTVNCVVAPVRDVVVQRSIVFENPGCSIILFLCSLPTLAGLIWHILHGSYNNAWGYLGLIILGGIYADYTFRLYRRRGRFVLLYNFISSGGPSRIDFTDVQSASAEFAPFVERLETLSAAASRKCREVQRYSLSAWWLMIILAGAFIALFTLLLPWFWKDLETSYAFAVSLTATVLLFAFSSERYLMMHSELRRAQAWLLDNRPEPAIAILQRFLERRPAHPYTQRLLTIAELLRGNMDVAEEVVLQGDTFDPEQPSWLMRVLYYRHWESRHGGR